MSTLRACDEIIDFPNNMRIEINYGNSKTYVRCKSYDVKAMDQAHTWHQIVIQHNGKLRGLDSKRELLNGLFDVIDGEEMYPVAYRCGQHDDRFLVRQCKPALDKLFAQNLRFLVSRGIVIPLKVQLNVAKYKYGQISSTNQISNALNDLFNNMENFKGESGILNLTQFSRNRHFVNVIVNLGNRSVLYNLCRLIYRNDERFRKVNGIIMKSNGITTLTPLTVFTGVNFAILDLRDNKIRSPTKLQLDLQTLKADELMLEGNPVTNALAYPHCLMSVLKNFKYIDGIPSQNLSGNCTPLKKHIVLEGEGYRIEMSNKNDINRFERSSDWHAFVVPDAENALSKEELFDYFFSMISPKYSDLYPCYYKYDGNDHKFVVRQCFDQIKYLIDTDQFKIRKSRHRTNDATFPQSNSEAISYYLLMNTSPFQKGQVEPLECIDKALDRRFNAMDRVLNLNNFQNIEGLENILINLSSVNILSRILMQASRKFLSMCVELRLAHNNITKVNCSKILALMNNLKAIDLSNNWLRDFNDIRGLDNLNIKSLCLDGNPLCAQYNFRSQYIKAVTQIFPKLTKLDNIEITNTGGFSCYKNYLCDTNDFDFVEQFVTYYFKTYESTTDRTKLKNAYHPQATLSMTCNYNLPNPTPQTIKRISRYADVSRNILKVSDTTGYIDGLHYGCHEIIKIFTQLPKVTFDFLTFTTTTTKYNMHTISITVTGTFLDQATTIVESDILMGFSRTFILSAVKDKLGVLKCGTAYQIFNDQFNIFNPTIVQSKNAFMYYKNEENEVQEAQAMVEDKEPLLAMMQELTQMKTIWCTRCLDEANWNFEAALKVFLDLYNKNEIPESAFS